MEKLILFFDTETTWFPNKKDPNADQPYIVQLGYILANYDGRGLFDVIDQRSIFIRPGCAIPQQCIDIHGITDAMVANCQDFSGVAREFMQYAKDADLIVGHNVDFDFDMLNIEMRRHWPDEKSRTSWLDMINSKLICTMLPSVKLCKLPYPSWRAWYKWPKLTELYKFLFGKDMVKAHDAFADITATMDCFKELHRLKKISITD